jgi:hypothetical protein
MVALFADWIGLKSVSVEQVIVITAELAVQGKVELQFNVSVVESADPEQLDELEHVVGVLEQIGPVIITTDELLKLCGKRDGEAQV